MLKNKDKYLLFLMIPMYSKNPRRRKMYEVIHQRECENLKDVYPKIGWGLVFLVLYGEGIIIPTGCSFMTVPRIICIRCFYYLFNRTRQQWRLFTFRCGHLTRSEVSPSAKSVCPAPSILTKKNKQTNVNGIGSLFPFYFNSKVKCTPTPH